MERKKTSSPYSRRRGQMSQMPLVRRRRKLWRSVKSSTKKRYKFLKIRKRRYYHTQITLGSGLKYRKRRTKQLKYRYVKKLYNKYPSQATHKPVPENPVVPLSVLPTPNDLRGNPSVPIPPHPPQFLAPEGTRSEVAVEVTQATPTVTQAAQASSTVTQAAPVAAQASPAVSPVSTQEVEALSGTISILPEEKKINQSTAVAQNILEQAVADSQIRDSVIEADIVPDPVFVNLLSLGRESDLHFSPDINRAEEDESVGTILKDETIALLAQQVQGPKDI